MPALTLTFLAAESTHKIGRNPTRDGGGGLPMQRVKGSSALRSDLNYYLPPWPSGYPDKTSPAYLVGDRLAARLGPHVSFQLAFAERNRLIDRFALLGALRDHLAHDSL